MKKTLLLAGLLAMAFAAHSADWKNLSDDALVSGDKLSADDMLGKVVLLYYLDLAEARSIEYLKEVEKTWNAFKAKDFIVVGTHPAGTEKAKVKVALDKAKVTFPVYQGLDLNPPPAHFKAPYFAIINHRGVVVSTVGSGRAATEAVVEALTAMVVAPSLCPDVTFKKYKPLEKQLVLGKSIANIVKKLQKDLKGKDTSLAAEAQEILSSIESAKDDIREEIELQKKVNPEAAIRLIGQYVKTWPKDSAVAGYKDSISDLKKAASEKKAADKEKAKEKAKAKEK